MTDGRQFVYGFDGNPVTDPMYPLLSENFWRFAFEEEGGKGYSLEVQGLAEDGKMDGDPDSYHWYIYGDDAITPIAEVPFGTKNFRLFGQEIAYRLKGDYQSRGLKTRFQLHALGAPEEDAGAIVEQDNATVKSFDFSPDGSMFVYVGGTGSKKTVSDSWYRRASIENHDFLEFETSLFQPSEAMNSELIYTPWDMVTTNRGFVVLMKADAAGAKVEPSFIQYYGYDGTLLHEVRVNHCVKKIAQLSDNETLYLRMDEDTYTMELMKITWEKKVVPGKTGFKPLIKERSFGDQTVAKYRSHTFGMIKEMNEDTETFSYRAPVHSSKGEVRLQIPYCDVQEKCVEGAESLLVLYRGLQVELPMAAFACDSLLKTMPCETEATIEIHLFGADDGHVEFHADLFVVESINSITKLVHRAEIYSGAIVE